MKINLYKITEDVDEIIHLTGWEIDTFKRTTNGSVYIDIFRREDGQKEWATIRIADHKQFYANWLWTYSVSPSEISVETLRTILKLPFGNVGDIL